MRSFSFTCLSHENKKNVKPPTNGLLGSCQRRITNFASEISIISSSSQINGFVKDDDEQAAVVCKAKAFSPLIYVNNISL